MRLTGFAARLTDAQARSLAADPRVARITPSRTYALAAQSVPTGIRRSHAGPSVVPGPVDVDVAVIDTGLSPARTDELNIEEGYNCVPPVDSHGVPTGAPLDEDDWGDFHGHGTHVAGTIAADNDTEGVVGVAPGARIWPIRVFAMINGQASGMTEWITCAIDHVASLTEPDPASSGDTRPVIEVVNMSLAGGGTDSPCSLDPGDPSSNPDHDAICRSTEQGTTYVVAAGTNAETSTRRRQRMSFRPHTTRSSPYPGCPTRMAFPAGSGRAARAPTTRSAATATSGSRST